MSPKDEQRARVWHEDLSDAGDPDNEPFGDETLASLDLGLKDAAEGRLKPLEQYEVERAL